MTSRRGVPPKLRRILEAGLLALVLVAGPASAGEVKRNQVVNPFYEPDVYGYFPGSVSAPYASEGEPTGSILFRDSYDGTAMRMAQAMGFEVHEVYGGLCVADPTASANAFDGVLLAQIIDSIDPDLGAEPDFFLRLPEGSGFDGGVLGSAFGRANFQRQNALATVRAKPAHHFATGVGVVVAVLDSGLDAAHPYLEGRTLAGWDFVDEDPDAAEGLPNGEDEDGDDRPDDGYGHGTTVAGLVLGAAPDASILPVRVLDAEGLTTAARVAAGIRWAVDHGADVVNMSLGGEGNSNVVRQEILRGQTAGVVFVAAAGNRRAPPGTTPAPTEFPANVPYVIAVSGIGLRGPTGDVLAPWFRIDGPYPGNRWFRGFGTSFGTALVSGGAALAVETRPGIDALGIFSLLSPDLRPRARLDLTRLARR